MNMRDWGPGGLLSEWCIDSCHTYKPLLFAFPSHPVRTEKWLSDVMQEWCWPGKNINSHVEHFTEDGLIIWITTFFKSLLQQLRIAMDPFSSPCFVLCLIFHSSMCPTGCSTSLWITQEHALIQISFWVTFVISFFLLVKSPMTRGFLERLTLGKLFCL